MNKYPDERYEIFINGSIIASAETENFARMAGRIISKEFEDSDEFGKGSEITIYDTVEKKWI